MGIRAERIQVTGLPVRAAFAHLPEAPAEGTCPRLLLVGGGRPSRWLERATRALVASPMPMHLIVVCGRNARLRRRLHRVVGTQATVLGWRDDLAALMRWSTLVITKGGPTTVAEALCQARPVLIAHVLPGQEAGNVALVQHTGTGAYMPDVATLVGTIEAGPSAWPRGKSERALWWGGAARRVAQSLLAHRVRTAEPEPRAVSRNEEALGDLPDRIDQPSARSSRLHVQAGGLEGVQLPPGKLIVNPISGERIVIRATSAELLAFDLFLPRGAHVPARHAHPIQQEQFTIITGLMRFRVGRQRRTILAKPGDTVIVPAGTAHWFGNVGPGVAHARVEARPALRMEEMFAAAATMGVTHYLPGAPMPRLSDLALFLREFRREVAVPEMPASLVRGMLAPFAWLGRRHRPAGSGSPR
jgi:quercetin dioxygenase-like cupin family protein